jgi:hypothetical protein
MSNINPLTPDHVQEQLDELREIARDRGGPSGTAAIVRAALDAGAAYGWSRERTYLALSLALAQRGADMERMLVEQTMLRPPPDIVVYDSKGSVRLRYMDRDGSVSSVVPPITQQRDPFGPKPRNAEEAQAALDKMLDEVP